MENTDIGTNQVKTGEGIPEGGSGTAPQQAAGETSERTFTQAELDNIISNRLAKFGDYNTLKEYKETAEAAQLSDMERMQKTIDELSPYKDQASQQGEVLEALLTQELEAIPEGMKGLIPESFNALQKLEYIRANASVFKTSLPRPNMHSEQNPTPSSTPGLFGGKYATLSEYATKDPQGYSAWRKSGGGNDLLTQNK